MGIGVSRHMRNTSMSIQSTHLLVLSMCAMESNLEACGFVCQCCDFRLMLSDLHSSTGVLHALKAGAMYVVITCPQCDAIRLYARTDLLFFSPDGNQLPFAKGKSTGA